MSPPLRIVVLAGLPATGKSTIARELAAGLGAPLFDKDRVREALFGPAHVAYSREQDDFCTRVLYSAVEHVAERGSAACVVLDGRTYSRRYQVAELAELARRLGAELVVIECVASREAVRERLASDGGHPARDRTFERWLELEASAEPDALVELAPLRVDTSRLPLSECIRACREELARRG
jgi:predicted kinase